MGARLLCLFLIAGCSASGDDPVVDGDCEVPAEGCLCDPEIDTVVSCFDGEGALVGVGICEKGVRACDADTAAWGACDGQTLDAAEQCDSIDNDCDGSIDEEIAECEQLIRFPGACSMTSDVGLDGTIDRSWTFFYDEDNRLVEQLYDSNNDGALDVRYTFTRDETDRVVLREQFDAAATLTGIVDYIYQDEPSRLLQLIYKNPAGTPTREVTYIWSGGLNVRQDHDVPVDGTVDQRWFYYYDDGSRQLFRAERELMVGVVDYAIDYTYDGAGNPTENAFDTNGDGAIDEQRFRDYSCWDGVL